MMRTATLALLALAGLGLARSASAQQCNRSCPAGQPRDARGCCIAVQPPPVDPRVKQADRLFAEAQRLLQNGQVVAACAKFGESLDTLVLLRTKESLAACYERAGQTASAWTQYREAADLADKNRDKSAAALRAAATALEPKLPRLLISARDPVPGMVVERDGVAAVVGRAEPVDPGPHTVTARAPGWGGFEEKVTVGAGLTVTVEIPGEKTAMTPPPVPPVVPVDDRGAGRRRLAFIVGGVGLAGVGVGIVTGLLARSKKNDSGCNDEGLCPNQEAFDKLSSARTMGTVATVASGIGLAALATGVVLYVTAPKDGDVSVAFRPTVGGGAVVVTGVLP